MQPSADPVRDALRACPVFAALPEQSLAKLAGSCAVRRWSPGQLIFRQGDHGDCLYVIVEGAVDLSVIAPSGRSVLLAVLSAPAGLGELAVIDNGPRAATATARGRTALVRIERDHVRALLAEHPSVGAALLGSLAALVRRLDEHTTGLSLHPLASRVRRHLLAAALDQAPAGAIGPAFADTLPLDLRTSQADLARQVGGSRQQVNRILAALEAAGAIERSGPRIVAVRPQLLAEDE